MRLTLWAARRLARAIARRGFTRLLDSRVANPREALKHVAARVEGPVTLYIHIPYCIRPCGFCCFVRKMYREEEYWAYVKVLMRELEEYASALERAQVISVYVGGGTPTINREGIIAVLEKVRQLFPRASRICVEAHPATVTRELVKELRGVGVNRFSIGVQSLDQEVLRALGRLTHTPSQALEAVKTAASHFDTLNVDLIFGVPGVDPEAIVRDAEKLLQLGANQVTFYPLLIAWGKKTRWSRRELENADRMHLERIVSWAREQNLKPETIWCYSKASASSIDEYIVETPDYVGVGISSIGHVSASIYANTFTVERYVKMVERYGCSIAYHTRLTREEEGGYQMLMSAFSWRKPEPPPGCLVCKLAGALLARKPPSHSPAVLYAVHRLMKEFLEGVAWLRVEALRREAARGEIA